MRKKWLPILLIVMIVILISWALWANSAVERNDFVIREDTLPEGFDGFRIAHISDLHSAGFYMDVVELLQKSEPDIICITGDLMDRRDKNCDIALAFASEAVKVAPCYYITGNHEANLSSPLYNQLLEGLQELGVTVLADQEVLLQRDGDTIALAGHFWGDTRYVGLISRYEGYRILLSHQPEDLDHYAAGGYDLVLSGHAHGGQFRLPFVGGLFAPGQGFFPKYDSGVYAQEDTDLVVSRGIGNSSFPLRIGNRPEVVLIILECEDHGT